MNPRVDVRCLTAEILMNRSAALVDAAEGVARVPLTPRDRRALAPFLDQVAETARQLQRLAGMARGAMGQPA